MTLLDVVKELDEWLKEEAREAVEDGMRRPGPLSILVHGQMALFERRLQLALVVTKDVDALLKGEHSAKKQFEKLLLKKGLVLDPVGHEAWMPAETNYEEVFSGEFVTLRIADVEAVLLSKGLKAPEKNGPLLTEYLAKGASERFLELADKYGLDLEQFL